MPARRDLASLLRREFDPDRVLDDSSTLAHYGRDASGLGPFAAEAVVFATCPAEVAILLRLADEHGFPVTPRGAGTGLTGGALPVRGGVVLSLERMTAILDLDDSSLVAAVEPGVVTGELQRTVEALGLFYPPDPASLGVCTLGGNVAHNAGGPRALKYGVTREYVLGLEAVLIGGRTVRCGRRTFKGVTGYDLTAMFVGSEGTLGVVTQITLKLLPAPRALATLLAVFPDAFAAGEAVTAILRCGQLPRALELIDRRSIAELRAHTAYRFPPAAGAVLICELDGEPEGFDSALAACAHACERAGAIELIQAFDERERESLWAARRAVYPALVAAYPRMRTEDICVPRAAIPEALRRIDRLASEHEVQVATIGHAGDGNLHLALLRGADDPETGDGGSRLDALSADLLRASLELGGTVTAEHGIGHAKRQYLPWEVSPEAVSLQRQIKHVFDPKGLLNPGKIFPDSPPA
jgi:glycolate oxidase